MELKFQLQLKLQLLLLWTSIIMHILQLMQKNEGGVVGLKRVRLKSHNMQACKSLIHLS